MEPGEPDTSVHSLELPASMDFWDDLFGFVQSETLRCIGGDAKEYPLVLACEELLSNIIRYNYGDTENRSLVTILILSSWEKRDSDLLFRLQISDNGVPFDPHFETIDTSIADIPIEKRKVGGLGLFLIKTSVDHIDYRYVNRRNTYTFDTLLNP